MEIFVLNSGKLWKIPGGNSGKLWKQAAPISDKFGFACGIWHAVCIFVTGWQRCRPVKHNKMTFEEKIKALHEAGIIRLSIEEQTFDTFYGVNIPKGNQEYIYYWFQVSKLSGGYMFHHAYSQNTGKTDRNWLRGFNCEQRINKLYNNL